MKKTMDLMVKALQQNNIGDCIPENSKKKIGDKYLYKRDNFHALMSIHSSLDAWILDSSASHHMESIENIVSCITTYTGPPILMGNDTPVEVTRKGRVELQCGSFENLLMFQNAL
jgi:hypothetical protein